MNNCFLQKSEVKKSNDDFHACSVKLFSTETPKTNRVYEILFQTSLVIVGQSMGKSASTAGASLVWHLNSTESQMGLLDVRK